MRDLRKTIVCSACDSNYLVLFNGLMRSIRDKPESDGIAIGLLDLGLSESEKTSLDGSVDHIAEPGWDLSFVPPDNDMSKIWTGYRAMTARPFLRDYFPGYDRYIWIDSDCWVQQWFAMEWLLDASVRGAIAIVPELDRAYNSMYDKGGIIYWMHKSYQEVYGEEASRFGFQPILNAGVFAIEADAPHWAHWAEYFQKGLDAKLDFAIDQLSLSYVIYKLNLKRHFLPSRANWLINRAMPCFDMKTSLFTEPFLPNAPLGIIHLSGTSKTEVLKVPIINTDRALATKLNYNPDRLQTMENDL